MINRQSHKFSSNLGILALTTGKIALAIARAITLPVARAIIPNGTQICVSIYTNSGCDPQFPAVGELGTNDLVVVFRELIEICSEWENIGLELQLSPGAIKGPYKGHRDCFRDMLKEWLNTSPDPSWQSLIRALRSPIVGKEPLARRLEGKYCLQEESVPSPGKQG